MKSIDKIFGVLLVRTLSTRTVSPGFMPSSFLIIRPGGIGDAILLFPTIKLLKIAYPSCTIDILAEKRNAAACRWCPHVNNVLLYDKPKELLAAILGKYSVVIDSEQWHRLSAVVTWMTGARVSIGYSTNVRKRLFAHPVSYSHDDYEFDSFCHLIEPLGISAKNELLPFLSVPDLVAKKAESLLRNYSNRPFVAIFPGASIPEKRWDIDNFVKLAGQLNQAGIQIIVIGSEKERAAGDVITRGLGALNLAGQTSLVETAAIIGKSSLLVSGDSGVLHIAAGLGKPTVSIFGPSNVKKWAPRGDMHIIITRNLPCSPCSSFGYTPKCPIKAKCMRDITVDEVFAAVERQMLLPHV